MKNLKALVFLLAFFSGCFFISAEAQAAIYNIGPGETYTTYGSAFRGAVTLQPGDIVDGGGNSFSGTLYLTNARTGTEENPIIIRNFNLTGTAGVSIYENTQWVTIENVNLASTGAISGSGPGNSNIVINNCDLTGGADIAIGGTNGLTISNTTIDSSEYDAIGLSVTATSSNVTLSNVTVTNHAATENYAAIGLKPSSNLTLDNVQVTGSGYRGIHIYQVSGTISLTDVYSGVDDEGNADGNAGEGIFIQDCDDVLLQADGVYSSNNTTVTGYGIWIVDSELLEGSYLRNFEANNNAEGKGIQINNSPNLNISDGEANENIVGLYIYGTNSSGIVVDNVEMNYNRGDGFNCHEEVMEDPDPSPEIIVKYSEASYNGTIPADANGDGFSNHVNCNVKQYYCKAVSNTNTGIAHVGESNGIVSNSIFIDNGTYDSENPDNNSTRSNIYLTATNGVANPGYTFYNNIGSGGYPNQIDWRGSTNTIDFNLYNPTSDDYFYGTSAPYQSWLTYHTTNGNEPNSQNANPLFTDESSDDFTLTDYSPAIDAGTHIDGITENCSGTCVDYAGNPIYGLPDIGAYEYQPPYEMGDDEVSTSASIRMYGDEKFRNKEASDDSTTADLSVEIPDSDKSEWLDIEISSWGDTKTWTEETTESIAYTVHTIGGLTASTNYEVSVDSTLGQDIEGDNCTGGVCTSNAQGEITFTYTGTYSSHTFSVVKEEVVEEEEEVENLEIDDVEYESTTNTITIKWDTNNDADSKVKYGTQKDDLDKEEKSSKEENHHKIVLEDLNSNTTYYFKIHSKDDNDDEEITKKYSIKTKKDYSYSNYSATVPVEIIPEQEKLSFIPKKEDEPYNEVAQEIQEKQEQQQEMKQPAKEPKQSFFSRIWNLLKGLFGG